MFTDGTDQFIEVFFPENSPGLERRRNDLRQRNQLHPLALFDGRGR